MSLLYIFSVEGEWFNKKKLFALERVTYILTCKRGSESFDLLEREQRMTDSCLIAFRHISCQI